MAKTQRTDPHRPGAIIPAEYDFVLSYSLASSSGGYPVPAIGMNCEIERATWLEGKTPGDRQLLKRGEHDAHGRCCVIGLRQSGAKFAATGGAGKCSVCGACYIYGDVWRHEPTGEHIHIGHDCAEKYRMLTDRSAFELSLGRARQAAAVQVIKQQNAEERAAFLAKHPGLEADLEVEHRIIADIRARFQQYRTMSDKQVALVRKLANEVRNPRVREEEKHVPAPTGRVKFQGVVVSSKSVENDWGGALKIIVKVSTPDGVWLAWLTCPQQILNEVADRGVMCSTGTVGAVRGCEVEVTATLTPGRDAHFAFGKRPNGRVVKFGDEKAPGVAA